MLDRCTKNIKNHQAYFEGICKTIRLLFLNFRLSLPYLKDWLYFKNIFGFWIVGDLCSFIEKVVGERERDLLSPEAVVELDKNWNCPGCIMFSVVHTTILFYFFSAPLSAANGVTNCSNNCHDVDVNKNSLGVTLTPWRQNFVSSIHVDVNKYRWLFK